MGKSGKLKATTTTDNKITFGSIGRRSASGEIRQEVDQTKVETGKMTIIIQNSSAFHSESSLKLYSSWLEKIDMLSEKSQLSETESAELLTILQHVRNKIIGNRDVKKLLVDQGIIKRLINTLKSAKSTCIQCQRECAVMIGSLIMEGDAYVLKETPLVIIQPLLQIVLDEAEELQPEKKGLLEASLRALRTIFRYQGPHRDIPFESKYLKTITGLARREADSTGLQGQNICQYSLCILANCCDSAHKQKALQDHGVADILSSILESSILKNVEIGLDLLASLCRDNAKVSQQISKLKTKCGVEIMPYLMELSTNHPKSEIRLLAAVSLTNIYRSQNSKNSNAEIVRGVLPALTKLLDEKGQILVRTPLIIAFLVNNDDTLQLATLGCNTIAKLTHILEEFQTESNVKNEYSSAISVDKKRRCLEQACENALIALAAISSSRDECRKVVIESNVLKIAVKLLSSETVSLRSAACQCIRSLSRSVKNLRTHLVDAGIVDPIIKLLAEKEDLVVKTAACATICNMVLDFSPMKTAVLEKGAVEHVLRLLKEQDSSLRLNAVWAMKNLLYMAEPKVKQEVMEKMKFDLLYELTCDADTDVQIQALNILRNLACGEDSDILQILQGFGTMRLLNLVHERLSHARKEIILQSLYIVVNVATGGSLPKGAIMSCPELLQKIRNFIINSADEDIKLASIWCIINLTWPDDDESEKRVSVLKEMGFEEALRKATLVQHLSIDLNERAALALDHFTEIYH